MRQAGHQGREDADRVKANLQRIAESRLHEDTPVSELERYALELKGRLTRIIIEEKRLRMEKVRLAQELARIRQQVLDLKRERLQKSTLEASCQARTAAAKEEAATGGPSEVERLERRAAELEQDVDAFGETLSLHRRDRDRAFRLLQNAQSSLQDLLTENVLWRIVAMESGAGEEPGRSGKSGVTAELLGRLLVLEREESQVGGIISRLCENLPDESLDER